MNLLEACEVALLGCDWGLMGTSASSRGISGFSYNWILAEFLSPAPSTGHRLQEYSPLHDTLTLYSTVVTICATPHFSHTMYVLASVTLRTGFICLWNITSCSLVDECVDCGLLTWWEVHKVAL